MDRPSPKSHLRLLRRFQPGEFLKDDLMLVLRNADTRVPDLEPKSFGAPACADENASFGRRIFHCVGHEIAQEPTQQAAIR